jgi:hypothetical protein
VCYAALGHLTPGQAQRAHYVTAELNPVMYAWAQYYAVTSPPPLAAPPPPPEVYIDRCKVSNVTLIGGDYGQRCSRFLHGACP